jgi:hypothetical protein
VVQKKNRGKADRTRVQYTRRLIVGIASYAPYGRRLVQGRTGGTDSARYCYSVWLRHLCTGLGNGLGSVPEAVGEVGPGDSVGTGVAALLSGASRYYGFDVVAHAENHRNEAILEELVELFARREPIPDEDEFPHVHPKLRSYEFPRAILTDQVLDEALAQARLNALRRVVRTVSARVAWSGAEPVLTYQPNWFAVRATPAETLDFVFSQAVMEHVDHLEETYRTMYEWMRPGALVSHDIDLTSHGFARDWNGHWTYADVEWRLIRGRRSYAINRVPCSRHLDHLRAAGFEVVTFQRSTTSESRITMSDVAPGFVGVISEEDLRTPSFFVQARRPPA